MESAYIILLVILIMICFAWATAKAAFWLWWMMGEPMSDGQTASNAKGRIFSKLGIWVCKKFNQFEQVENARLGLAMHKAGDPKKIKGILDTKKTNPYKALGVCVICMGFHFANINYLLLSVLFYSLTDLPWYVFVLGFAYFWAITLAFLQHTVSKYLG